MVCVVCAPVAISATVWCWCCPYFIGSRRLFRDGLNSEDGWWIPEKERAERVLASAILIGGRREGRVNSAQNRMCGRDAVAGAATMTSRQVCVGSIGRRLPQGLDNGLQALRRRARRRKAWKRRIRSFGSGLRTWKRRKVKESKEGKGFHQGERAVWQMSRV